MSLSIDGNADAFTLDPNTTPLDIVLTTSQAHDVILIVVQIDGTRGFATVSSITGGGLSWAPRAVRQEGQEGLQWATTEYWWAPSASILSMETIHINVSTVGQTFAAAFCVAVGGAANYLSPFDTNASLPYLTSYYNPISSRPAIGPFDTTAYAPTGGNIGVTSTWWNGPTNLGFGSPAWATWGDAIVGTSTDADGVILLGLGGFDHFGNQRNGLMDNGFTEVGFSTPSLSPLAVVPVTSIGFKIPAPLHPPTPGSFIRPFLWVAT